MTANTDAVWLKRSLSLREQWIKCASEAEALDAMRSGVQVWKLYQNPPTFTRPQPAAPQVVAWRWPGGHWDDGEPTERDEAELARVGVKPEFAYSAPPAAPQVPEGMSLFDRVEFALRDAGFDYDEAFDIASKATPPAHEQPRCATCDGRGEIGGHVGQTPESFDFVTEPCPECSTSEQPKPEQRTDAELLAEMEASGVLDSFLTFVDGRDEFTRDGMIAAFETSRAEQPKPAGDVEAGNRGDE